VEATGATLSVKAKPGALGPAPCAAQRLLRARYNSAPLNRIPILLFIVAAVLLTNPFSGLTTFTFFALAVAVSAYAFLTV